MLFFLEDSTATIAQLESELQSRNTDDIVTLRNTNKFLTARNKELEAQLSQVCQNGEIPRNFPQMFLSLISFLFCLLQAKYFADDRNDDSSKNGHDDSDSYHDRYVNNSSNGNNSNDTLLPVNLKPQHLLQQLDQLVSGQNFIMPTRKYVE